MDEEIIRALRLALDRDAETLFDPLDVADARSSVPWLKDSQQSPGRKQVELNESEDESEEDEALRCEIELKKIRAIIGRVESQMNRLGVQAERYVKLSSRLGQVGGSEVVPLDSMQFFKQAKRKQDHQVDEAKDTSIQLIARKTHEMELEKNYWKQMTEKLQSKTLEHEEESGGEVAHTISDELADQLDALILGYKATIENTKRAWQTAKSQLNPQTYSRILGGEYKKQAQRYSEQLSELGLQLQTDDAAINKEIQLSRLARLEESYIPLFTHAGAQVRCHQKEHRSKQQQQRRYRVKNAWDNEMT